jgi:hypothetical protein
MARKPEEDGRAIYSKSIERRLFKDVYGCSQLAQ